MTVPPAVTTTSSALRDLAIPDLLDPELYRSGDPHEKWHRLRQDSPVSWHDSQEFGGLWHVTRYDDVRAVLRDANTFSSASGTLLRPRTHGADPGGGRTLALTDAPRHRGLREIVAPWFSERAVRSLKPVVDELAAQVVEDALEMGECDVVADLAANLPLLVICQLMGVPEADQDHLLSCTSRAFGSIDPIEQSTAHQMIMAYFIDLIDERERHPGDDLVSALVHGVVDGSRLSFEDVLLNCDNLLVGGTENVRLATAGGIYAFGRHPSQWSRIVEDPDLVGPAVEEVMRWTSSATHLVRRATTDAVVGGTKVDAGDTVVVWLPSANRDERQFEYPDVFDVARSPNRHLALGGGPHYCVGVALARAEMSALIRSLLARGVEIEQSAPEEWLSSLVVNGLRSMPVRVHPTRERDR